MTIGEFLNYILFTGLLAAPVVQMASIGTQISEAFAGLDRIRELMQMTTEDQEDATKAPLGEIAGAVDFDRVSFEYNPGTLVLKDVSFRAPAGTTTALVGSSGSGKSTLISLVMAFNRPLSGRILVDGQDLASVRLRDYREQLGVVLQDNFLFDGSIADNIKYGKPDATLEDIKRVSRIAHADEFIETFEKGYDTIVGERGVKLSGGQRQRVSIARAILADPRILVLDEATSSLDSESEALIQDGLQVAAAGPDDVRHRAPAVDDPQRGPDPRPRARRDRRARHARRAHRARRPLPHAVRQAVQVRSRPVHQPRRGLHARPRRVEDPLDAPLQQRAVESAEFTETHRGPRVCRGGGRARVQGLKFQERPPIAYPVPRVVPAVRVIAPKHSDSKGFHAAIHLHHEGAREGSSSRPRRPQGHLAVVSARREDRRARAERRGQEHDPQDHGRRGPAVRRRGLAGRGDQRRDPAPGAAARSAKTVLGNVEEGVADIKALLTRYDEINAKFGEEMSPEEMDKILEEQAKVQDKIEAANAWDLDSRLELAMDALRLPPGDADVTTLSGGERRRVALCRLLLKSPDLLLLDEPTNHLDAESVAWLERFLKDYPGTVVAVTHDRYFLDNVAGWILELDRGSGIPWEGNYSSWLEQKQNRLALEEKSESKRQRTLERELDWIRMSPRARQAKGKARLNAYEDLLKEESAKKIESVEIYIPPGPRLGDIVVEARGLKKGYGDTLLMEDVNFTLPRGGIVGVIGPNGAGKTTLFRMITGHGAARRRHAAARRHGEGRLRRPGPRAGSREDGVRGDYRRRRRSGAREAHGRLARLRVVVQLQGTRSAE